MGLDVHLLGTFAVHVDGAVVDDARWTRRQAAMVVKLLALAPNHRLHQEQIMETLWPGAEPETAANGLHKMVHLARHALEPELSSGNGSRFLLRSEGLLQLASPDGLRVDADDFEHLAVAALRDADEAAGRRALQIYQGDLLPSERFAEWASARRDRLRGLRLDLLGMLGRVLGARGELAAAIGVFQQLLALDAANEPAHRGLMDCFARAGARVQALRQFEHCRAALQRELAAQPDAATVALHAKITAGEHGPNEAPRPRPAAERASPTAAIAVLPFANLIGDPEREFVASGLSDAVIRGLSKQPSLRVMASSTVQRYRGREVEPREVGRELGVGTLLLGRVERAGRNLVVSVELVRAADGTLLWGERLEGPASRLQEFEHVVTTGVAARVAGPGSAAVSSGEAMRDPLAYEHYLRGRHEWGKRTAVSLGTAARHFERAIAADDRFALAFSGLADCHSLACLYAAATPHTNMPKAREAAARAIALDPQLAEAHASAAYVHFAYDWDLPLAESGFRRAIALAPNYATAHQWLHELLAAEGRVAEQRATVARAHALDPLSPVIATEVAFGFYFAREAKLALPRLEQVVATSPQFALAWLLLGATQLLDGDDEAACQTIGHALRVAGDRPWSLAVGAYGHALARAGRVREAREQLQRLRAASSASPAAAHAIALIAAGLGDHDLAFASLERALAGRTDRMAFLRVEPMLDALREDPRFVGVVARVVAAGPSAAGVVAAGRSATMAAKGSRARAGSSGRKREGRGKRAGRKRD